MHEYTARIEWRRLAAEPFTDNRYHRGHRLLFDGGTELAGSSSPAVVPVPMSDAAAADARYDSQTVSKFINVLMYQGKKATGERIFYGAMDIVEAKTSQPGVNIFKQALTNLKPVVEVKSRRVGGATYQVPVEVRPERRTALAMRWLISFSRDRNEKSMAEKLAAEVIAASKGEGNAVKKKEDTHRMADANKAFAHYRW